MNFLMNPIGSIGDLHPYLGIGQELLRRGHEVSLLTNPHFEAVVRKAGLPFVETGSREDLDDFWRNPQMWDLKKSWKIALYWSAIRPMRPAYENILQRYRPGETVLVGPGWAFGARIAQEKHGIPMATLHLSSDKLRSVHKSPAMPPPLVLSDWVPKISKRSQLWIADRFFIDPVLAPETNAFRAELGLPPVKRFIKEWWNSPQLVIGLFPAWYSEPQPDWPPRTVLTGFPLWDQSGIVDVPEDVGRFLDEGEPPVVFTFGTANEHTRHCLEASVESCRILGCRGILIAKRREELPENLPDGVRYFPYVPFTYLLRRAAVLVHHAGTGTTAQGLAAGIPQLVTPMAFGQPDNAMRITRLGAAYRSGHGPSAGRRLPVRFSG